MINGSGDLSMQKYQVKEDVVKKRTAVGNVSYDKQYVWQQLIQKGDKPVGQAVDSLDSLKAAKQRLQATSTAKRDRGGLISYDR